MKRITTTITRRIATVVLRCSWRIMAAADRLQAQGERMEHGAYRIAQMGGIEDEYGTIIAVDASAP